MDYSNFAVSIYDTLSKEDQKNRIAYIEQVVGADPPPFKHEHYLFFRDGKCVGQVKDLNDIRGQWRDSTMIQHYDRKSYLASFPDEPEHLKFAPDPKTDKDGVQAQYFRYVFPPQHIYAPQWHDCVFFPHPIGLRLTFNDHGKITVEHTTQPAYYAMNWHKPVTVRAGFLQDLEQYDAVDRQRTALLDRIRERP